MLERDEGRRNVAYQDSLGLWTIGIGHHDANTCQGMVWTDQQINDTFAADVAEKTAQCEASFPWIANLDEPRKAVVIAMCFQMGIHRLAAFVNTLNAVKQGDYEAAAEGMLNSLWAHQTPKRAARMAVQMQTGDWT